MENLKIKETIRRVSKRLKIDVNSRYKASEQVDYKSLKFCRSSFRTIALGREKEFESSARFCLRVNFKQPYEPDGLSSLLKQTVKTRRFNIDQSDCKRAKNCASNKPMCLFCKSKEACSCRRNTLIDPPIQGLTRSLRFTHNKNRSLTKQFAKDSAMAQSNWANQKKLETDNCNDF